ncbi:MAG TPA: enoyl-[acyl-carrier-protein] reductase FabK [Tissierellia bacterium]|nr:enoyl-[acyl-carrier-protein] reductase FabK [Tissierellia bacterium]
MIDTPITQLLGIKYPIFQGGMAWVAEANLAAAVSNGGGLGIIAAMNMDRAHLKAQIDLIRSLTEKPFGVNVMLMSPYTKEVAELLVEEKVPVITTGAGNPQPYIEGWKQAGSKIFPVIASVALAKLLARAGADGLIAEGAEGGGHVGETTTMALIPQVVDAVDIPVIAAGGIADGRGIAAAFMLGASGVQMGTAFLLTKECRVHPNYKDMVLGASDIATMVTGRSLGHPVRSLKTRLTRSIAQIEKDTPELIDEMGRGALRCAVLEGDKMKGCFMAGQIAGLLKEEVAVKDYLDRITHQADRLLRGETWTK